MTIQLERVYTAPTSEGPALLRTLPADMWDLPASAPAARKAVHVRTLEPGSRNRERRPLGEIGLRPTREEAFETRHENRANVFMGAALGLALILGSAAGGAFSGDAAIHPEVSTVENVTAHAR
ncbi:hypothetical protein G7Y29_06315 [Corynebacterium qintianiae]|uniref:Uncharacterized protein n=1 Tax=Corynebacterium qintianiae TaxID=2709392 RepID=A0A7T0KL37_9CORY|nr:hypothetical protein [Corynebacterium qintianiae]QPK82507.1 hypothetical protein G7Y29_06315 [Corynebacterium qintianiae]